MNSDLTFMSKNFCNAKSFEFCDINHVICFIKRDVSHKITSFIPLQTVYSNQDKLMNKTNLFSITIALQVIFVSGCKSTSVDQENCKPKLIVAKTSPGYFNSKSEAKDAWETEANYLYGNAYDDWGDAQNKDVFRVKTDGKWPNRKFRVTFEDHPCRA